ncbi:MAG: hypothetical protein LBR57_04670 [Alistipes sp.]|jgi:regulator of replication initiation timing|nr:hypothetical protein [Alistipes sp.]
MSGKALIESIARGAGRLIEENRRLTGEVERLEASRGRLREENRRLAAENSALEQRLTVKDLAAGFGGGSETRQNTKLARARVNRLMREVDKCIALLNKDNG